MFFCYPWLLFFIVYEVDKWILSMIEECIFSYVYLRVYVYVGVWLWMHIFTTWCLVFPFYELAFTRRKDLTAKFLSELITPTGVRAYREHDLQGVFWMPFACMVTALRNLKHSGILRVVRQPVCRQDSAKRFNAKVSYLNSIQASLLTSYNRLPRRNLEAMSFVHGLDRGRWQAVELTVPPDHDQQETDIHENAYYFKPALVGITRKQILSLSSAKTEMLIAGLERAALCFSVWSSYQFCLCPRERERERERERAGERKREREREGEREREVERERGRERAGSGRPSLRVL